MVWTDDAEVPAVERRHLGNLQTLSGGDNRGIDCAQRKVSISSNKLRYPEPVGGAHRLRGECARSQIANETNLGVDAQPTADEVGHLGYDQFRHDQRTGMCSQQLKTRVMMPVVGIDVRIKRTRVDQKRDGTTSLERISSMRSEMSSRPLRPAAAASSGRLAWSLTPR